MSEAKCSHGFLFVDYCHLCDDELDDYFEKRRQHMKFCLENDLIYEVNFEDYQRSDFKQRKEIARW